MIFKSYVILIVDDDLFDLSFEINVIFDDFIGYHI